MGADNQPRHRQAEAIARKRKASKADTARVLIVSEGSKTEPQYFQEIRQKFRLPTANLQILPSRLGTDPLNVVNYAEDLLLNGSTVSRIEPKAFEHVFAVFDRDDHATYSQALEKAGALDCKYRNDLKQSVRFQAIASVPCFELWLLLHFQEQHAAIHRDQVISALRRYLPNYAKGQGGHFAATAPHLEIAQQRATALAGHTSAFDGVAPYTGIHELVAILTALRAQ